jgi:NADH-quinone oxidoreductase subunit M
VISFPILTMLVLVPAISSVAVAVLSNRRPEWIKLTALLSSVFTAGLSIWVLTAFDKANADYQFVSKHTWIKPWGISWHLGVDGISLFLVVLTGILFPLVIAGIDPHHDHKRYLSWMLLLEAGVMGSFLSLDLFVFFVFFEIVLVPMYFLIAGWGYEGRVYAATKFFLYTMVGSAFMLVGIVARAVGRCRSTSSTSPKRTSRRQRGAGCSSPSLWRSPSRCRSFRCTPGCPMLTLRHRPVVR